MATDQDFPDPADFDLQAQQLARRRKIAEQMISRERPATGQMVGNFYIPNWGGMATDVGDRISANKELERLDQADSALSASQARARKSTMDRLATPGTRTIKTVDSDAGPTLPKQETVPLTPEQEQQRRLKVMGEGLAIPSLRQTLQQQIGQELDNPRQDAIRRENAEARQHEAEMKTFDRRRELEDRNEFTAGQNQLYKRTADQIAAAGARAGGAGANHGKPPSGYRFTTDGGLEAIPGGPADKQPGAKPLTAKQLETQRGFMDLRSSLDEYDGLLDKYDFSGKTAINPAERARLEGAFTDVQMKMKTLYELGAPQAGDLKLLEQSLSNPTSVRGTLTGAAFGRDPHKAKTGQLRKLLSNSQTNFERQMGNATPAPAGGNAVVRSQAEWQALAPGTPYTTPDGRKGVR